MRPIRQTLQAARRRRALRSAKLPWAELEAEAIRQRCSPADIFFDRAGRPGPDPVTIRATRLGPERPGRPGRRPRDIYGRPIAPRPPSTPPPGSSHAT